MPSNPEAVEKVLCQYEREIRGLIRTQNELVIDVNLY